MSDHFLVLVFFFQAEDGIRDLVRSRGLGDVYKRQAMDRGDRYGCIALVPHFQPGPAREEVRSRRRVCAAVCSGTVSYTHLTLPTSDLV